MPAHASTQAFRLEIARRGRARCAVSGHSMGGAFARAARIEVVAGPAPEVGDVVVVDWSGRLVVHRLLRLESGWIRTRGDAMPHEDLPLPRSALLGRVVALEDRAGRMRPVPTRARALLIGLRARLGRWRSRTRGL